MTGICKRCDAETRVVTWVVEPLWTGEREVHEAHVCNTCGWKKTTVRKERDRANLVAIEIESTHNQRGQCLVCQKKSWRWSHWAHVELWFDRHICQPRKQRAAA